MPARAAPLIGRSAELARISEALADAPRFVLVCGEPGIGKTRLVEESARLARARDMRVLTGVCVQGCERMPFLPLLQPLAEAAGRAADAVASDLLPRTGSPAGPDGGEVTAATRLVATLGGALAAEPTLLIVDDVHWADPSTIATLDYLARRTRDQQLVLVLTTRDDQRALRRLPFTDGRVFERLDLPRLTRPEVRAQVASLTGMPPPAGLVERVFARSAGNPLFVSQLLQNDANGTLPATLTALLNRQLAGLDLQACRALAALAVLGGPHADELVAAVAGLEPRTADAGLQRAADCGVVRRGPAGVEFQHPLYREGVLASTGHAEQRDLHRAAAERLTTAGASAPTLARHWVAAEDRDEALRWSWAASETSAAALAFPEARDHLRTALDLWPDQGSSPAPKWQATALAARYTWLAGDASEALVLARRAVAERPGETQGLALSLAEYAWDADDVPTAIEAFQRAAALVDDSTSAQARAAAYFGLARALVPTSRYAEACAAARAGLTHAVQAGSLLSQRRLHAVLGVSLVNAGEVAAGLEELRRGTQCGFEPDNLPAFVAATLSLSGRLEESLAVSLAGIAVAEREGIEETYGADLRGRAGLCLLELGRWDEADQILATAARRGLPDLARGLLALRRGRLDEAAATLADVSAGGAPAAAWPGALASSWALARAELAVMRNDTVTVRSELAGIASGHPETPWDRTVRAEGAALSRRAGIGSAAAGPCLPDPAFTRGLTAEACGDWDTARAAWTSPWRPYRYALTCLEQAAAQFASGDRTAARAALHEAGRVSVDLGAAALVAQVEDLARRARVAATPVPRSRRDPSEPTPRELVVLHLLAEGLMNREIAQRLFLSPKTVGIHVSRLLRKLDAHTRGEAVAAARRRGLL